MNTITKAQGIALAAEFLDWRWTVNGFMIGVNPKSNAEAKYPDFNPYEDENHWRILEEKIFNDHEIWRKWNEEWDSYDTTLENYIQADLNTRMNAFIAVYQKTK